MNKQRIKLSSPFPMAITHDCNDGSIGLNIVRKSMLGEVRVCKRRVVLVKDFESVWVKR